MQDWESEETITQTKVKRIIKMLKKNKAPGENQITAEMIAKGGNQLEKAL